MQSEMWVVKGEPAQVKGLVLVLSGSFWTICSDVLLSDRRTEGAEYSDTVSKFREVRCLFGEFLNAAESCNYVFIFSFFFSLFPLSIYFSRKMSSMA